MLGAIAILYNIYFFVNEDFLWKTLSSVENIEGLKPNLTFSGKYKVNFLVVLLTLGIQSLNPMNPYPAISRSSALPFSNSTSI